MGLNLKKKLKRAVKSTVKLTVKKPLNLVRRTPKFLVNTIKNPLDFKSAAGLTLLGGTQISTITHPKELGIVSGLGAAGTFLSGASAAAGGAASSGTGAYTAGASAAATTTAASVAKKTIADKVIEKGTDFALETALKNKIAKDASKNPVTPPTSPPGQPAQPGTIAGIKTSTLITGGISLLSLIAIIAR